MLPHRVGLVRHHIPLLSLLGRCSPDPYTRVVPPARLARLVLSQMHPSRYCARRVASRHVCPAGMFQFSHLGTRTLGWRRDLPSLALLLSRCRDDRKQLIEAGRAVNRRRSRPDRHTADSDQPRGKITRLSADGWIILPASRRADACVRALCT